MTKKKKAAMPKMTGTIDHSYKLSGIHPKILPNVQIHARETVLAKNSHTAVFVCKTSKIIKIVTSAPSAINRFRYFFIMLSDILFLFFN